MIWNLEQYGDSIALLDEYGNRLTYGTLNEETIGLSKTIGQRCLVFVLCQNTIGSIIGYVSFVNNGIVPLLLNSNLDDALLINLINVYKPTYLWVPKTISERFNNMKVEYEVYNYVLLNTRLRSICDIYDELALLLTTSGSTGSPKFVRQSYANISANAHSIVEYLKLDDKERAITLLPMYYTFGLSIINSHLLVGATLLVVDKTIMQKEFWSFLKDNYATSISGVPYTYEMLDKLRFYRMNIPSLKTLTQAGGKLQPKLHEKFASYAAENGKEFIVMYGQCEATARMSYLSTDKALSKIGSIGKAIPGGRLYLVDESGNEINNPYTEGELVYEGTNVTLGYAESDLDLTKGDERMGVLKTGDIAQFDSEGYFYIVGRKKRFLKIFGNRVNLDEIDSLIRTEFGIDVASSGVDDCMYVFITSEKYMNDVRDYVIKKTKLNHSAFKIMVIDTIPKNETGKILYSELYNYIV